MKPKLYCPKCGRRLKGDRVDLCDRCFEKQVSLRIKLSGVMVDGGSDDSADCG
jgi:NMD protein affecting ribosome stability and mRNA decay